jgi:plasmid replication initiation protein
MKQKKETSIVGKDEMNLAEFPISLLAKRHESNNTILEFSDTIEGKNGKPMRREWTVTGSEKCGLPLAFDNDVLLALMVLGKEKNFDSRKIYFTRYRLCEIMGWQQGGCKYIRIEEALDRLQGVSIKAKNAVWDNERKVYVTKNFGIIDDYELMDSSRPGPSGQDTFPFSYVNLNEVVFESIKAGYIKSLDLRTYFDLESAITKRLYRYLDKKSYGNKKKFEMNLFTLAYAHLGFNNETYKYASDLKKKLTPSHEELIHTGFLRSAEYQKTSDGSSEKVIYIFSGKTELTGISPDPKSSLEITTAGNELLNKLTRIGITRKVADQIMREYPRETILTQVEALPLRKAEDPPAVLVASIMNGWSLPPSYHKKKQHETWQKAEKLQQEQECREKGERRAKIEEYLSSLPEKQGKELKAKALEMAQQEGGAAFKHRAIPECIVNAYLHALAEKNLMAEPVLCAT